MDLITELLAMWQEDSKIDRTEPGNALIDIPKLHSKYLGILSKHRMAAKELQMKYVKAKKIKYEYYTGRMDQESLNKYSWEPFPFVLKTDLPSYLESDDDLQKILSKKAVHDEIVEICTSILKELSSRTYQLKSFIDYEKFIQGS